MSDSTVLYETDSSGEGVATITLNRPHAKNALSSALMRELTSALETASQDDAIRVVILTGAGDAFCAGVDLKEFGQLDGDPDSRDRPDCWRAMDDCAKPIIGAINGPAITGGFEIALACDVLIAGRNARFADTHGRVGVIPGAGLSQRLPRAIGIHRAKYLSLTGNFLSATQAADWGLVSHVVEDDALMATARQIARDMLGLMPHMLPAMKAVIDDGFAINFADAIELEARRSNDHLKAMKPQKGASAAFRSVRERGRNQKT
jgi:enoyl-CoA hydratase